MIRRRPSRQGSSDKPKKEYRGFIVVPYVQGLSEPYKRLMENAGIRVYFTGANMLKSQRVSPKDKDPKLKKSNCVYQISCTTPECNAKYIGETGRTLEERLKDHVAISSNSAIKQHCNDSGHPLPEVSEDNIEIIDTESNVIKRRIIESLYIKINDPDLNRNVGKMEIPEVYDKVLREKGGLQVRFS